MNIDDKIVKKYLAGDPLDEIKNHWIFDNLEEGKHLFEPPSIDKQGEIEKILSSVHNSLSDFNPLNRGIYSAIYPEWAETIKEMNVLLIVGCPNPYDAMVKEHHDKQYIVFDLLRLNDYVEMGYRVDLIIKQLITHETSHLCLHKKYPVPTSKDYKIRLKHMVFDEGFAHLLAFHEDIEHYNFTELIEEHYMKSWLKLSAALEETNPDKQKELLIQADSGSYWDKFASVSGKLFLAMNRKDLVDLYHKGIDNFIEQMELRS